MTVLPRRSLSAISLPFSSGRVKSGALSLIFMGLFRARSEAAATVAARTRPAFSKILHRRILVRGAATVLVCLLGMIAVSAAQEERPQITPGERKGQKKKDPGPRALGILQMTAAGKASLVPIAILVNGKFFDATAYKADPVPMALDSGNVYEGERTGNSLGLFTVNSALHSNGQNVQSPWIGAGSWLANGTESPNKGIKAEASPVGIEAVEGPPRLTKDPAAVNAPPSASKDSAPPKTSAPSNPSSDEPPRLSKPKPDSG